MNETTFDPNLFLDAAMSEPLTKRPPLPQGSVWIGVIGEVTTRQWTGKQDPTKSGWAVDFPLLLDLSSDPAMVAVQGTDRVTLKGGIMIDTKENGAIDNAPGKNGALRKYREAVDLNKPGDSFSFRMLTGRMVKVKIKHREYQGEMFDEVDSVARV